MMIEYMNIEALIVLDRKKHKYHFNLITLFLQVEEVIANNMADISTLFQNFQELEHCINNVDVLDH